MNLNFQALRALQAFVEDGSIARAALRIQRTEPQVSRLLSGLQQVMGFSILSKQGRKLVMTQEGRAFYAHVAKLLQVATEVEGYTHQNRQRQQDHVRVVSAPHTARGLLVDALAHAVALHPGLTASVDVRNEQDIVALMVQHEYDIALTQLPVNSPWLNVRELAVGHAVIVMRSDHPLAHCEEVTAENLQMHAMVNLPHGSVLRDRLEQHMAGKALDAGPRFEASSGPLAGAMAARGFGVALLDPFAALGQVQADVCIRKFKPRIALHYGVLLPADKPASAATEWLIESLYDLSHQRLQSLVQHL